MKNLLACCGFALAVLLSQQNAKSAAVVTVSVVGDSVVADGSGSLNLAALTFDSNGDFGGARLDPVSGVISVGPAGPASVSIYTGIKFGGAFGGGSQTDAGSPSGSGDIFGVGLGAFPELTVPEGYVSGSALSGKTTWANVNMGNLDLTAGTYVWTWGTGGTADSLTLKVDTTSASAVPEPGTYALFALTGLGLIAFRRRIRE
jgi:PEP-CTERM motif-containing protein